MSTPMDNMMRPMNPHENPNKGQYASELPYHSEMHVKMTVGAKGMIGDARKMSHRMVVESKTIDHTSLTERRDEIGDKIDVTKNFSRLPKVHQDPQPNDFGEPVHRELYKKDGKAGIVKGGIKYGKK